MRILHVSDCYWPRLGGIEGHLRDLIHHQRAAGHDARILTTTPAAARPDDPWVYRVDAGAAGPLGGLPHADAALRRLLAELAPDVVHVHVSVFSPLATLAAHRAARLGHPTVVTVHSMWTRLGPLPAAARALLRLRTWPISWSAVSGAAADPLRTMLGPDIPVRVLPNAVDPELWRPENPAGPMPVVPTVVSVMRLTRTKRTLPLARILRDVRRQLPGGYPLRAVIVGEGPQRAALGRYLRRHRMDGWVELPGRLDRSAVRDELGRGSVYVAPAELESFGIAALEARTAGLPVVASALSGVGDFVTHGTEGLLGTADDSLASHVVRLLTDDGLRSSIARHNATVPPRHDWAAACRRADEVYLQAAASAGAQRRRWSVPLAIAPGGSS
jgi:glycosyltransferase involved in cell wall biosynthesis